MAGRHELLAIAGQIVSAHVESNTVPPDELPKLIQDVYAALSTASHVASRTNRTSASGASEKLCLTEPGSLYRLQ
jgi:predicted transcriptional regulator